MINAADFSAPLSVALSATLEARSVVGLASTLTKDALALVDDITDLCRFDQGRVLLVEKEAVKIRDICLEALMKVPIPVVGTAGGGGVDVALDIQEGAPGRTMTDRAVFQRSLALLLNFAVDAAANAVASGGGGGNESPRGMVILSVSNAVVGRGHGGRAKSACKISVFYTNPPDANANEGGVAGGIMNSSASSAPVGSSSAEFASAYTPPTSSAADVGGSRTEQLNDAVGSSSASAGGNMRRGDSFGTLPAIFNECYSSRQTSEGMMSSQQITAKRQQQQQEPSYGSMMRRVRLRESIQGGMTSLRRDKLGLGLSLLYHLVGAQGSDLRYEIVSEVPPSPNLAPQNQQRRVAIPSMTKFWFLLPMSLDFPDRLPAEHIVKDDHNVQVNQHAHNAQQQSAVSSLLTARSLTLLPSMDVQGMGSSLQQPRQKRARLSSTGSSASAAQLGAMSNNAPLVAASAAPPTESTNLAAAATKPSSSSTPTPKQYPGVAPGARPLVLVVEDTDVSASLLCMHLRKLNCTSHRAENGEVAIEMLRSAPAPNMYSLILMDLRMPVMDGFEATKIIKGSNACNIPVVALTGETSEENRTRCNQIGFDDYKTKPLKRPQLKELLKKLVPGYTPVG